MLVPPRKTSPPKPEPAPEPPQDLKSSGFLGNPESILARARLLADNKIGDPAIRKLVLKQVLDALVGRGTGLSSDINIDEIALDREKISSVANDLLLLARVDADPGSSTGTGRSPSIFTFSDDSIKDRMHRLYISSMPFKISMTILAVGTALFGVNLGFLSLDTKELNRVKNEAEVAAEKAKIAADNANNTISSAINSAISATNDELNKAISEVQEKLGKEGEEKLNIPDIQSDIVNKVLVTHKFDTAEAQISKITDDGVKMQTTLNSMNTTLSNEDDQLRDLLGKTNKTSLTLDDLVNRYNGLITSWETYVTVARDTAVNKSLAGTVWLILSNSAWFLLGVLAISILSFFCAFGALYFALKRRP